jgi:hypothetical protein
MQYLSPFKYWERQATVKSGLSHQVQAEAGKLYYVPELVPLAQHRAIVERDLFHTILVEHLFTSHAFTVELEDQVVNRATQIIADGVLAVATPYAMRLDAHRAYIDEGNHRKFCYEQMTQVETVTALRFRPRASHPFIQRFRRLQTLAPREHRLALQVCAAVVTETLITTALKDTAHDERVVGAVRDVMADHWRDETRHHAYFCALFGVVWPQLAQPTQCFIGPLLPQFILGFLQPHYPALQQTLMQYGFSTRMVTRVLQEAYPTEHVLAEARQAARATLRLFERHGIFEEPSIADAFHASGLL